jgi:hypothetical protein
MRETRKPKAPQPGATFTDTTQMCAVEIVDGKESLDAALRRREITSTMMIRQYQESAGGEGTLRSYDASDGMLTGA